MKQTRSIPNRMRPIAMLFALSCAAMPSVAADWKTSAEAKLTAESSDNIRLDFGEGADDAIETSESIILGLERDGRQFDLRLTGTGEFVQYTNSDLLEDEENQFVNLTSSYQPRINLTYGLDAAYAQDTYSGTVRFLDGGIDGTPIGDPTDGLDGSLAREQTDLERLRILPSVKYELSARSDVSLEVDHTDYQYGQQQFRSLFDYDDTIVAAKYGYKLSAARGDHAWIQIARGDYSTEFQNGQGDAVRYPVEIGYSRDFSERLTLAATIGAVRTEFENLNVEETEPTFTASATMRGKRSQYFLSLAQFVRPSSSGRPIKTQQVQFNSYYKLQENAQLVLVVNYIDNSGDANTFGVETDSDYLNVEPAIKWSFSPNLAARLKYSYKERSDNIQDLSGDSNSVLLSLEYKFWPGS